MNDSSLKSLHIMQKLMEKQQPILCDFLKHLVLMASAVLSVLVSLNAVQTGSTLLYYVVDSIMYHPFWNNCHIHACNSASQVAQGLFGVSNIKNPGEEPNG